MQEQEGFCGENQLQLEEFNYVPTSVVQPYRPKQYNHQLKLRKETPPDPSPYLDPVLQQQLKENFRTRRDSHLIYEVGAPPSKAAVKDCLLFDSNYENANLEYVTSGDLRHYELFIRADTNTKRHFQWFCFKVKNGNLKKATLTIKNLVKPNMLYREGLRPFWRSLRGTQKHQQLDNPVTFRPSSSEEEEGEGEENVWFELTFQLVFALPNDEIEICSQPPYPSSRISKTFHQNIFKRVTLAKSVMGHSIDAFLLNDHPNVKAVAVVFARQHPGESVSSWLMEGLADRLGELSCLQVLWVLVPMVNVDGVVMGNSRTGVLGFDFNRHWYIDKDTNRFHLFPELMGILRYLKKRQKEWTRKVKIFLDLHGHSSQSNVFSYGPPHHKTSEHYELSRLFPYLIQTKNPDFHYSQCSFEISPAKKHCARSIFFERLGFHYSYTIESSFGIYNRRNINETDMVRMGKSICEATLDFIRYLGSSSKVKYHRDLEQLSKIIREGQATEKQHVEDDSDSEEERGEARQHFQDKMAEMLAQKGGGKFGSSVELALKKDQSSEGQLTGAKSSALRYRFKTEIKQSVGTVSQGEECLFLPRLKCRSRSRHTAEKQGVGVTFNNLSLSEIKEKLYCIRNSKFGRRLLIG